MGAVLAISVPTIWLLRMRWEGAVVQAAASDSRSSKRSSVGVVFVSGKRIKLMQLGSLFWSLSLELNLKILGSHDLFYPLVLLVLVDSYFRDFPFLASRVLFSP